MGFPMSTSAQGRAGPGIHEEQLQGGSGLRVGSMAVPLFWQPDLCTGPRPFGGTYSAVDVGMSVEDVVPSGAYSEPIVNSSTWKEVKVSQQVLPFPCTPSIRLRETAGDATFATASTGGVTFRVRLTGLDQYGVSRVWEMPKTYTTLPNNVVQVLSPGADNRALDTILHCPQVFTRIEKVEYQASGVHANEDFLDVGVAWCLDAYAAVFHGISGGSGATSLTHWGTRAPSVRFPWANGQAIGIPMHQQGIAQNDQAVDNRPFPKVRLAPEVLAVSIVNLSSPDSVLGGGEVAALDPQIDNSIGSSPDVADSTVINGVRILNAQKGGWGHNRGDPQGYRNAGGAVVIPPDPGRVNLGLMAPQLSMNPCNMLASAVSNAHVQGAIQFVATGNLIYRGEGSFIKDGWVPGMTIAVSGTSSNNALATTIVKVEKHRLTLAAAPTNETSTSAVLTGTAPNSRSGMRNFGYASNKNDQLAGNSTSIGQTYLVHVTFRTALRSADSRSTSPSYPR